MNLKFIINKILKRRGDILREFRDLSSEYSLRFAFITLMWWISYYLHWKKGNNYFIKHKQKAIDKIIESEFSEIVAKYKNMSESTELVKDFRIWVFWAQGEENMPLIVESCYRQLKKVESDRVFLITLDNIREFLDFPDYIYKRIKKGLLSLTHFSDIIRVTLLAKYGGMWYDATCWITSKFPDKYKNNKLFSPHNPSDNTEYVGYAIGTELVNSILFSFTRDILLGIQKKFKTLPDYLIISYTLNFALKNLLAINNLVSSIPINNTERFLLFAWMNTPFDKIKYENLIKNNWIFKLSYKAHYKDYIDGKPTFYHHLINS